MFATPYSIRSASKSAKRLMNARQKRAQKTQVQNKKSSISMDSSKHGGRDGPYEELDLENDRRGQTAKFYTAAAICEERWMGPAGVDNIWPIVFHA
jgi:hypothetical protein